MKGNQFYLDLAAQANAAAEVASQEWLAQATARGPAFSVHDGTAALFGGPVGPAVGYMLDNCGGAYLKFRDRRNAHYKNMLKAGLIRFKDTGTVEVNYSLRGRQEMGLHEAAKLAAKKVYDAAGVPLSFHSYID